MFTKAVFVRGWTGALFGALCVFGAACAPKLGMPSATPSGDQAPVGLRNLQMATADGHRAVLLRLSRVPTLVRHSSAGRPARIMVQAWGPLGDDLPEKALAEQDPQITQVRVSRSSGALSIILDLQGDNPPQYTVHQMADWIMVRFTTPEG
jgi:hypothetical protein